jgi:flagellar biosynthesis/type III secretory pathway protein FliH
LAIEEEERRYIEEKIQAQLLIRELDAHESGYKKGFETGLEHGNEQAYREVREQSTERLEKFDSLVRELDSAKQEIFRANERFLIELVFRISKMILLKEVAADRDYVGRLISHIIENVGVRENIKVRFNPEEGMTAEILSADLLKRLGNLKNLQIETSSEVSRGGCEVETQWNRVDATIETQLQRLYQSLMSVKDASEDSDTMGSIDSSSDLESEIVSGASQSTTEEEPEGQT